MSTLSYAGARIELDDDGFLTSPDEWNPVVAEALALLSGVTLTPDHWHVVNCARELHVLDGRTPDLERIGAGTGLAREALQELFPGTPETLINRIAGIPRASAPRRC